MLWRRVLAAVALISVVAALAVVVGWPDLGGGLDAVTGHSGAGATEFAVIGLLCWLMLATATMFGVLDAVRQPPRRLSTVRPWLMCVVVVTAGGALLAGGVARQQHSYQVCCANPSTAHQAEQLVH